MQLSNTPVESKTDTETESTYRFGVTPKMSTYLVAFAIGHFDHVAATVSVPVYGNDMQPTGEKRDCLIRVFCGVGKAAEGEFALKWACDAFTHFTDGFRYNYPLTKMVRVVIWVLRLTGWF
jgi:aminopeptidase N